MTIKVGARPATIDGCWSTWREQDIDMVMRANMETGFVKSRRRFTGRYRAVNCTRRFTSDLYQDFLTWFETNCRQGLRPTEMTTPYSTKELFGWSRPPSIRWIDTGVFEVDVELYQLPSWSKATPSDYDPT